MFSTGYTSYFLQATQVKRSRFCWDQERIDLVGCMFDLK